MKLTTFQFDSKLATVRAGAVTAVTAAVMAVAAPVCAAQTMQAAASPAATIVDAGVVAHPMASISNAAEPGKTLHVLVGHSVFIDTKTRLRRVYIADPGVLNSVTLSPNQILVTAMNPGLSSLTLVDEMSQAQSYMISSDVDLEGLRAAMAQAMPGGAVKVDGIGSRVTLTGRVKTQEASDAAAKLAGQYAKDVTNALVVSAGHPKQVRLQVRILEIDRSKALQLGINLFSPGGNSSYLAQSESSLFPSTATLTQSTTGSGGSTVTASNPLNFLLYSAKLNLGATIQDLQTKQVLQILAEPTLTAISGEKADFLSGGEFPFPVVQPGGTGSAPVISISFRPFGVKLEFTPIVNDDGTIRLKVAPEVSALDYSDAVTVSGISVPAISTRRAQTEVELRSDQSFAISGLLDQRTTDLMAKNPGAANIPILGYLFKSKNQTHSQTELVVVVTPTVVDPLDDTTGPKQPGLPIEPLEKGQFDKSLGRDLNPNPGPPAIHPDDPPYGGPLPAAPPAATGPAAAAPAPTPVTAAPQPAAPVVTAPKPTTAQAPVNPASAPAAKTTPAPAVMPGAAGSAAPAQTPAPQKPQVQRPVNAAPSVAAAKPVGSLVEIVALSHESDADAMVAALQRRGYNVAANHDPSDSLVHLDVGPFTNKRDAETMRMRLLQDGYNATIK